MANMNMKLVANHDGQVIISALNSPADGWLWYTFHLDIEYDFTGLEKIIKQIQSEELQPVSYNGEYRNYIVGDIYVSVSPPFQRSRKKKPDYMMLLETPQMYETYIKPKIRCPKWVEHIEKGNANGEVILHENDDYYLLPDFKWDRKIKNLYLLVIFKDPDLRSIRDLTNEHLPLLENTQRQVLKFIADNYGMAPSKIRCYFHYMPSAWRLHMHVQHVSASLALGSGTQCGRARLLGEIKSNIRLVPDYYQRANLECVIDHDRYNEFYIQAQDAATE